MADGLTNFLASDLLSGAIGHIKHLPAQSTQQQAPCQHHALSARNMLVSALRLCSLLVGRVA
jgi:hypothetical protein